jgi:integral membrane protein (TIGR01906 family)
LKIILTIAKVIFIPCLALFLIGSTLAIAANSEWLYVYGFTRYGVRQTLANAGVELNDEQISAIYSKLISYYNSSEKYVNISVVKEGKTISLFTPDETQHFADVKGLIRLDYKVIVGTFIYMLSFVIGGYISLKKKFSRELGQSLIGGSVLTLAVILALGILAGTSGFDWLWLHFHFLFFTNAFWYAEGYMLMLFPEQFFQDAAVFCGIFAVFAAVILGVCGILLLRRTPKTS